MRRCGKSGINIHESMRHFVHPIETSWPQSIRDEFRANSRPENPREAWQAFDKTEVRDALWELQYGLCAYCERVVEAGSGGSSIDHVIPKTRNPEVTFLYSNLVLCCTSPHTCNLFKGGNHFAGTDETGRWTQGFIAPTQERCEPSFNYFRDGSIAPSANTTEPDATDTLRILNLNHQLLQTERREHLAAIDRAIAALAEQVDALIEYLRTEMPAESLNPFYSAKRQCIKIAY
jgi:uncharacterized protein (TIGR02646 family)